MSRAVGRHAAQPIIVTLLGAAFVVAVATGLLARDSSPSRAVRAPLNGADTGRASASAWIPHSNHDLASRR